MAYICPFLLKIWKFLKIHHAILGQIYYFPSAQWDRFIFNMKNNHPWIVGWSTPLLWQDNISVWLNILMLWHTRHNLLYLYKFSWIFLFISVPLPNYQFQNILFCWKTPTWQLRARFSNVKIFWFLKTFLCHN